MDELMLLNLTDFGINKPGYIRKLNNRNHWNPKSCPALKDRVRAVVPKLFSNSEHLYSLWYIETAEQFYGVIASLSAGRTPRNQDIDFLWIAAEELSEASIKLTQVSEGKCLFVRDLHYNAYVNPDSAEQLCFFLMQADRQAQRCKKNPHTKPILEYQTEKGCKATDSDRDGCDCEVI